MRGRRIASPALGAIIVVLCVVLIAPSAIAGPVTNTFDYSGSATDSRPLVNVNLSIEGNVCVPVLGCADILPGTITIDFLSSVDSVFAGKALADYTGDFPDSFRQDTVATFTEKLAAKDGPAKEARLDSSIPVSLTAAWPGSPFGDLGPGTIAHTFGPINLLNKDLISPYAGNSAAASNTAEGPRLDLGQLIFGVSDVLEIGLDLETVATENAGSAGYRATRSLSTSSGPLGSPTQLTFPDANQHSDDVTIPCSAPAGENLLYNLTNVRWQGSLFADSTLKAVLEITLIPDPSFDLGSFTLINSQPLTMNAADFQATLGQVEAENKKPVVGAVGQVGTFVEGSDTTFSVTVDDNCTSDSDLAYRWEFSDGGIAFGPQAHHTFADNGTYTGTVKVTDLSDNSVSRDFLITPITNANPNASSAADATSYWGVPVQYHADAVDPGSADQSTLRARWSFGDGAGAGGWDVTHTYANPGSYVANLRVTDKDGGVGDAAPLTATISKRPSTVVYTGQMQSNPSKYVTLAATLNGVFGEAISGAPINFTLGSQSASGVTDISGLASNSATRLNQRRGLYPLSATYAGNSHYLPSSTLGLLFQIGN